MKTEAFQEVLQAVPNVKCSVCLDNTTRVGRVFNVDETLLLHGAKTRRQPGWLKKKAVCFIGKDM